MRLRRVNLGTDGGYEDCTIDELVRYSSHTIASFSFFVFSEREVMFMFAICRRPSVCLSSVTFVHPTQAIETFGNVSTPFNTIVI